MIVGRLDPLLGKLAVALRRRGLFTIVSRKDEQRTLDAVRIVVGVLALGNAARDLISAAMSGEAVIVGVQGAAFMLALAVTVGVATPLSTLAFAIVLNPIIDNVSFSSNLASMVLTMSLLILAFAPAGRAMSIDALLLRRADGVGQGWRAFYRQWGDLTEDRSTLARFCAFVGYAAISLYSALLHVRDDAWTTGIVNAWLFVSPWTNPSFYELADRIYREFPVLFVAFSQFSTLGTVAWQLTMVPLALLGRWPRAFVVLWGWLFFITFIFIVQLRLLGTYECVLWVLLFWRRWPCHSVGEIGIAATAGPRPPQLSPAFRAFVIAGGVLLMAFLARTPVIEQVPGGSVVASASRLAFGQAPLAFGLGPINVFNSRDVETLRIWYETWWTRGDVMLATYPHTNQLMSDTELFTLARYRRSMALQQELCGETFAGEYLAPLARRHAPFFVGARDQPDVLLIRFSYLSWPLADDLLAYRYVPTRAEPVCDVRFDAETLAPISTTYTEYGADLYTRRFGLPFQIRPEGLPLLVRYPCAAEAARLGWWFDWPALPPPSTEAAALVGEALAGSVTDEPIPCFAHIQAALTAFDLDWRAANPPPAAPCETDFELATIYRETLFDDILREHTREAMDVATVARTYGDHDTCLRAASVIRRAYLEIVGALTAAATLDEAGIGVGLPFPVHAEHLPLLYAFPCRAEAERIAWWFDRPQLAPRGPETTPMVVKLLASAAAGDRLTCIADAEATVAMMHLDWRADMLLPLAPCDADMVLAEAYAAADLGGAVRDRLMVPLARARAAHARDDRVECLLAAAEVRRTYFDALRATDNRQVTGQK